MAFLIKPMLAKGIFTLWYFVLSLVIFDALGQDQVGQAADVRLVYQTAVSNNLQLYQGKGYVGHQVANQRTVFLEDSYLLSGEVNFDGVGYEHMKLGYDLVGDKLIVTNLKGRMLVPRQDKIQSFSMANRSFSRMDMQYDDDHKGTRLVGFYEELHHSDDVQFLAKRRRILTENHDKQRIQFLVSDADSFYLIRNQRVYPITKRSSFRKAYPSLVSEVKEFHKRQKLDFRRDFEASVLRTVIFCDEIAH